jgi:nucleoid-associated protein YgaU
MLTHFFAGCLLAVAAVPDVVIPGTRSLRVTRHLEVSPLTEHCCVQHVVAKGETLSAIAAAHYGKATTAKDIAALNPEINPDRLKIGQRL